MNISPVLRDTDSDGLRPMRRSFAWARTPPPDSDPTYGLSDGARSPIDYQTPTPAARATVLGRQLDT